MNEDYLWDKSGETDPDIEMLENRLGRLRYRRPAEPLPLPATSRWSFRSSFSHPALAAAAVLMMLLLAGGLWLGLQSRSGQRESVNTLPDSSAPLEQQPREHVSSGVRPPLGTGGPLDNKFVASDNNRGVVHPARVTPRNHPPRRLSGKRQSMARKRDRKGTTSREELAREGEQAKAQLIMALHIASDKLNAVQKKIHTNPGT